MEAGPFSQHPPGPPGLCQAPTSSGDTSPALQDPLVLKGNPRDTVTPLQDVRGCAQEPRRPGSTISCCITVTLNKPVTSPSLIDLLSFPCDFSVPKPFGRLPFCPSVCPLLQQHPAKASASQALWLSESCKRAHPPSPPPPPPAPGIGNRRCELGCQCCLATPFGGGGKAQGDLGGPELNGVLLGFPSWDCFEILLKTRKFF